MPVPTRPALRARDDEGMVTAEAAAVLAAERLGPAGARVVVRSRAQRVEAVVTAEVHPLPLLPAFTVRASTTAEKEQP